MQSLRSQIVARRTYNRPLNEEGTQFETWANTIERVIRQQRWLWERAKGKSLTHDEESELTQLSNIIMRYEGSVSGRTLWLGGTEIARTYESSQFNCAGTTVKTVFDIVDVAWLLLQGCGVGFTPVSGVLNGFSNPIHDIEVIRSTRTMKGGAENNTETWLQSEKTWILQVGDSAKAWAKAIGKMVAGKYPAKKLILDLSQIRPSGQRLRGYGWISSGDHQLYKALLGIAKILNHRHSQLLSTLDILDVCNWIGTILSSRRSAELCLLDAARPEWKEFATAKQGDFNLNPQRSQSNNSLVFYSKPTKNTLREVFDLIMNSHEGSEPGIVNGEAALRRAGDFVVLNPCAESLLGDKSFCNLTELNLARFNGRFDELLKTIYLLARANYRQTCVHLDDGMLQRTWHELNQYLHLCGIGLTGYVQWEYQNNPNRLQSLYLSARRGTDMMAMELDMPFSKRITVIKPSGTLGKVMDCTEGVHKPLGKFIFNNINFSIHDPLIGYLKKANYYCFENPYDPTGCIVRMPVRWDNIDFLHVNDKYINTESAVTQLNRYKILMENYVDHNVSITVSYSPDEVDEMVDWIDKNWDTYVAAAFMFRSDASKTASDLGYPYLPQEVVSERVFNEYARQLLPVNIDQANSFHELQSDECASGFCPVK